MYAAQAAVRNRFITDGTGTVSQERLLIMLYERLLRDIDDAHTALGEPRNVAAAHEALAHAQDIVAELHSALNPELWEGGEEMASLYTYLATLLMQANLEKSQAKVAEARSIVAPMLATWQEAYQAVTTPAHAAKVGTGTLDVAG
ncbi:MAG: flagellar export chaperone FliS [Acidimicrobiia bacterium]